MKPTGAVASAAAIASESMILLNIDLRIAQVRPRVERKAFSGLLLLLVLLLALGEYDQDYEHEIF